MGSPMIGKGHTAGWAMDGFLDYLIGVIEAFRSADALTQAGTIFTIIGAIVAACFAIRTRFKKLQEHYLGEANEIKARLKKSETSKTTLESELAVLKERAPETILRRF